MVGVRFVILNAFQDPFIELPGGSTAGTCVGGTMDPETSSG
jgi:hypothetical protein